MSRIELLQDMWRYLQQLDAGEAAVCEAAAMMVEHLAEPTEGTATRLAVLRPEHTARAVVLIGRIAQEWGPGAGYGEGAGDEIALDAVLLDREMSGSFGESRAQENIAAAYAARNRALIAAEQARAQANTWRAQAAQNAEIAENAKARADKIWRFLAWLKHEIAETTDAAAAIQRLREIVKEERPEPTGTVIRRNNRGGLARLFGAGAPSQRASSQNGRTI